MTRVSQLLNLARWPIDALHSSPTQQLISKARHELGSVGCVCFPDFLHPDALASAAREAASLAPHAFATDDEHNAYQLPSDPAYPPTHVRNLRMRTRVASTAFDELAPDSPLRQLYLWDGLTAFVGALIGRDCHRLEDPLGCCSINIFRPGWEHAWHFDEAETTVTLCLQDAEHGGAFEYSQPLRTSDQELATSAVCAILREHSQYSPRSGFPDQSVSRDGAADASLGVPPLVSRSVFKPGTLQVFHGRYSLHRVSRVDGVRDRLVAVLCFAAEPGLRNSPEVQTMFWGRTA